MRNSIVYLEVPNSVKDSFVRYITVLIVLVICSYTVNKKLYLLSNLFLSLLLTILDTERVDYTILYSFIVGLCVFGYHNFRLYGPKLYEPYKFTGYGIVYCIIAGVSAHYTSNYFV